MTSFLQLHLLTAYPPSNLNRDDTGRPKTAVLGGVDRLRVSSQSLKRAWRTSDVFHQDLNNHLGKRTQRIGEQVLEHLQKTNPQVEDSHAVKVASAIAGIFGKNKDSKENEEVLIEQLAFVSPDEKKDAFKLADQIIEQGKHKNDKKELQSFVKEANILAKTDTAVDIAMFGRMLADDPDYNREASVQVSHAITTHKVTVEDDYYTAIDDLKDLSENAGAGFIGVQEFAAGVFYIYICIDESLLIKNLSERGDIAAAGIGALVQAAAQVAPKGKQASFASRAYAEYILAERGTRQPRSLVAAFLKSVGVSENNGDQMAASIDRLKLFRENLNTVYGDCADSMYEINTRASNKEEAGSITKLIEFASDYARGTKD